MKINPRNPRHWLLLLQQGFYTLIAIACRSLRGKPEKPVILLYGHQFSGNLKALYDQWTKSHRTRLSCYFLCLDPDHSALVAASGVNVLRCTSLRDMMKLSQTAALISDHGLHAMAPIVALTDIILIDVWHGIPFKGFTPEDFRLQHRYDEVWVSSPLLKELYQSKFGFKPEIVKNIGYARTDKLFLREPPNAKIREQVSIPAGHRVVLYAPTWQQDDKGRELFPFGESQESFLQQLSDVCSLNKATLVIRSHLNTNISTKLFDNVRYCSMKEFPDSESLLQLTDILICDWSSIAFDYLALDRPTIFLDVEPPFKSGFSLGREYRFGQVATDMAALMSCIAQALQHPNNYFAAHHASHRAITQAVYGEHTDGKAGSRQLDRLVTLVAKN